MTTVKFVDGSDRKFLSLEERAKTNQKVAAVLERLSPDARATSSFVHHTGSPDQPMLEEIEYPPDASIEPHAHAEDEIIVVTDGEAQFGMRAYGVGSSIFVPKMTLYSFRAGPRGLRILLFRPTVTSGVISKEEFVAKREGG